jgi:hypothetical protein
MDTKRLLSELREERDRISQAIAAIEALNSTVTPGATRAVKAGTQKATAVKSVVRRRRMSAAARKRISEAAKKRWAERKKAAKA